jgi:hypothetical protein
MANINTRHIPDELYYRVRMAAAMGGNRIPKGALERFVIRALRRAVEDPQPGAGLPRLKLCAGCFARNQTAFAVPPSNNVPPTQYETAREIRVATADCASKPGLFAHLLGKAADRRL